MLRKDGAHFAAEVWRIGSVQMYGDEAEQGSERFHVWQNE
jgi:hypothetical protein